MKSTFEHAGREMRRAAWIFLAAILLPSLGLAWLAVHSVRDQQVILEHQQVIISQGLTDSLATSIREQMDTVRNEFVAATQKILDEGGAPEIIAPAFNHTLTQAWPLAEVAFAVNLNGRIYSPAASESGPAKSFRDENDRFLSNRENVELYTSTANANANMTGTTQSAAALAYNPPIKNRLDADVLQDAAVQSEMDKRSAPAAQKQDQSAADAAAVPATPAPSASAATTAPQAAPTAPPTQAPAKSWAMMKEATDTETIKNSSFFNTRAQRKVVPQQALTQQKDAPLSNTVPEESDFRRVIGTEKSGLLARFLDNKLRLLVWAHPLATSPIVFGAQLNKSRLIQSLDNIVRAVPTSRDSFSPTTTPTYCLALLDDTGRPVAQSISNFTTDWKHPFVSTEIGDVLPHWEAALYLTDPQQISHAAQTLQLTLGLIVLVLIAAIVAGGWLIATDVRRQMRLAQQKTDFVSNVSHELKTPLTSIRMFADLLAEGRVEDGERRNKYLRIISAESARLTRLINNVLDFARLERGKPSGEHRPCDLVEIVQDVTETCRPHLESNSIAFATEIEVTALPISGDRDALAQIVLNLISNAEKYGCGDVFVRVRQQETPAETLGCVDVMDRGPGIPSDQIKAIFEPFHRLDDSLASGVPGSGLGLTLARKLARAHRGEVTYSPRASGGSCFTLSIPLTTPSSVS